MSSPIEALNLRREYPRLVALLLRRVGPGHLQSVEDALQSALIAALHSWELGGAPDNPLAWLYRVALRHLASDLRRHTRHRQLASRHFGSPEGPLGEPPASLPSGDLPDDLLRLLFLCCDGNLPFVSQLVLALKLLFGLEVSQIADHLFLSEAQVYKRLSRARLRLRSQPILEFEPTPAQLSERLCSVHAVLYLLFTEGHLSSNGPTPLRQELCHQAFDLTHTLVAHPMGATGEGFALLALMHLHLARFPARQNPTLGLLLLQEQDRSLWDPSHIQYGIYWLSRSIEGNRFSRYHAEAGVAAEHCLAPSFAETRWDRIVSCYELLEHLAPSSLHTLNRALALAEWHGPQQALLLLDTLQPPAALRASYQWSSVLSDLHRRAGHQQTASQYRVAALEAAPSPAIRRVLARRLT
jgi:RNA polymerase sigma factor (sigma-70 family)